MVVYVPHRIYCKIYIIRKRETKILHLSNRTWSSESIAWRSQLDVSAIESICIAYEWVTGTHSDPDYCSLFKTIIDYNSQSKLYAVVCQINFTAIFRRQFFIVADSNISTVTNQLNLTVESILIEPNKYLIIGFYSEW